MDHHQSWRLLLVLFLFLFLAVDISMGNHIPTTLEGPFPPVTRRFDPSLRRGSDDLPMDHPRLAKKVPLNFPEQIALAISSPTSMWVSWITGDAQIGPKVTPLDPSTVASEVYYGKESGKYPFMKNGTSTIYNQLYPFEGLLNYTSGIIHHVKLEAIWEALHMQPSGKQPNYVHSPQSLPLPFQTSSSSNRKSRDNSEED